VPRRVNHSRRLLRFPKLIHGSRIDAEAFGRAAAVAFGFAKGVAVQRTIFFIRSPRRLCAIAACAAVIALSGCAAVNPYWKGTIKHPSVVKGNVDPYAGGLGEAIDYAREWQKRYYKNAGQDAMVRSSAVLAIPLGGAALFRASTGDADSHSVVGLGIGGATLYGLANSLSSTPRQRIYMAGSITLSCAIDTMYPYAMDAAEHGSLKTSLGTLQTRLNSVSAKAAATRSAIETARADTANPPGLPQINSAEGALTDATAAMGRAQKTLTDGYLVSARVTTAGLRLTTAVDAIVARVGDQLAQTQVDLQSLASIVSGLGSTAATFRPTVPSAKPPAAVTLQGAGNAALRSAVTELNGAIKELETAVEIVAAYVNASAAASTAVSNAGNPSACELAPLDAGFRVDPDTPTITLAAGQSRKFTTSGGVGLPRGNVVGSTEETGAVLTPGQNDGTFTLTTSATSSGGEVQLVFTDGTGRNRKVIAVTVTAATTASPPASGGGSGTNKPPLPKLTNVTAQQLTGIQVALNKAGIRNAQGKPIGVDGGWGDETFMALRAYQTREGLDVTGTPTTQTLDRLKPDFSAGTAAPASGANSAADGTTSVDTAAPANAKNDFERTLTAQQIASIRLAFALPSEGGLNQALRDKISAFQPAPGTVTDRPAEADQLSAGLVTRILATQP
jgi:hypothetical protein